MRTLLIANRGAIARRIVRTAREMGIRTIGVYAEPDRLDPFVQEVDVAVPLGGRTPAESYLDRSAVLDAAAWQGADAIHPGDGFLAEHARFAEAVIDAGLTWVGPPPAAIRTIADKAAVHALAAGLGIDTPEHAVLGGDEPGRWAEAGATVGYPLNVRAASGRGGFGMRRVDEPGQLAAAVQATREEASLALADGTTFLERIVEGARHIEVQLLADGFGQVVHLGERECSIHHGHRRLVAEAPSPGIGDELRERLTDAAIDLAHALEYRGAGTVEFLVVGDRFWFIDVDARLQASHTVTEEVTRLDLVRLQLEIADGHPLPVTQYEVRTRGHAIGARLHALDADDDFTPATGHLHRWRHGPTTGIRHEDAVATGSSITAGADPLLAQLVAHAPTRAEAAARLGRALRELQVHGVTSTRGYLIDVLDDEDFLAGATDVDFVAAHPPVPPEDDPSRYEREWQRFNVLVGPHLAAAALADPTRGATRCTPWPFAPTGWRNVGGSVHELRPGETAWRVTPSRSGYAGQRRAFERDGARWEIAYSRVQRDHPLAVRRRTDDVQTPSDLFNVIIDGPSGHTTTLVEIIHLDDEVTLVHFGRRGHRCTVHVVGDQCWVNSALGQSEFRVR